MAEPFLRASHLAKSYGPQPVLRDVSLDLSHGECVAVIGRNGCGKSTLLRLLAGLTRPTEGSLSWAPGLSIGYVPERFPTPPLRAAEYLRYMGRMEGIGEAELQERIEEWFSLFRLADMARVPLAHLSKGSLQKVGVIQALLAPHDLLILDEPLSGQDIASQQAFTQAIGRRKAGGEAVLLCCHEPFLVNRLADRVYSLEAGALVETRMEDALLVEYDLLTFTGPRPWPAFLQDYAPQESGDRVLLTVPVSDSNRVALRMMQEGYTLKEFRHADGM